MTYDKYKNLFQVKAGSQTLVQHLYSSFYNELQGIIYGNGQYYALAYDTLGRLSGMTYNGNEAYRYHYGSDGRIGYEEDLVNNVTRRYEYDNSGKLLRVSGSTGELFVYDYDTTTGELTGSTFYDNANPSGIQDTYTYSNYSGTGERVLSQISRGSGKAVINYTYDGFYRASKTVKLQSGASVGTEYAFRPGSASNSTSIVPSSMTQMVKTDAGSTVSSLTYNYTYDVLGNISTISEGSTEKARYHYDSLNQLTREDNAYLNKTVTYSYDLGGNITGVNEYA